MLHTVVSNKEAKEVTAIGTGQRIPFSSVQRNAFEKASFAGIVGGSSLSPSAPTAISSVPSHILQAPFPYILPTFASVHLKSSDPVTTIPPSHLSPVT